VADVVSGRVVFMLIEGVEVAEFTVAAVAVIHIKVVINVQNDG